MNGLNPVIFLECVDIFGLARDKEAKRHMKWLLEQFEKDPSKWLLYAFNVDMNTYQYINGKTRIYVPKWKRNGKVNK